MILRPDEEAAFAKNPEGSDTVPQINGAHGKQDDPLRAALDELKASAPKREDVNRRVVREVVAERRFFRQFAPVLAACWEALMEEPCERELAEEYSLSPEWFIHHYRESYIVPILVGPERMIAGAMWFHNGDVHLAIKRRFRRTGWVKRLPEMFEIGFRAFGPKLIAKINAKNRVARRFTEKLGGMKVAEDAMVVTYEMHKDRMTYGTVQKVAGEQAGESRPVHLPDERGGDGVLHGPDDRDGDLGTELDQGERSGP